MDRDGAIRQLPPMMGIMDRMCRLCFSELDPTDDGVSVFNDQTPSMSQKIFIVFGIRITDSEDWPNKLCSICFGNTEKYYSFRQKYKRSESSWRDMLNKRTALQVKTPTEYKCIDRRTGSIDSSSGVSDSHDININTSANKMNNCSTYLAHKSNASHIARVNNAITSSNIKYCLKESCQTRTLKLHSFQNQVVGDGTSNGRNVSNKTIKKIQFNSPGVIVKPAYKRTNVQGLQIFKFPKGNFTSELHPQLVQVGEMDNDQDQLNGPTDPSDRISVLLFAAKCLNKPKSTIEVSKKIVLPDNNRIMKQTQITIKRCPNVQVQQLVKNKRVIENQHLILNKTKKLLVEKKCTNCEITYSTAWRRLNNELVCNACGLYYKLHGQKRPQSMRSNTVFTRQSRIKYKDD